MTPASGWTLAVRKEPPRSASGWYCCATYEPPEDELARFMCEITGEHVTGYWRDIRPGLAALNLPYYWWKLTAIGRTQLESRCI